MRKLYFKLILSIWTVMIISSAGAVVAVKMISPAELRGPGEINGPGPQRTFEQILPSIASRASFEASGSGEQGLIDWFRNDQLLARGATYILSGRDGRRLIQSGNYDRLDASSTSRAKPGDDTRKVDFEHDGEQYTLSVYMPDLPDPGIRAPGPWQRAIAMFAFRPGNVWLIILIAVPLSVLLSIAIARYLVSPLRSFQSASRQMGQGDLSIRVRPSLGRRVDEIADFAATFDQMAAKLETLVRSHKELLRDVSHELRSPLARVHAALSLARQRTSGAVDVEMDRIELEVDRLNGLIEKLLTFARLDAKQVEVVRKLLDVGDVLEDVVSDTIIEARAQGKNIELADVTGLRTIGDAGMLASCFENIIRNAIHHTPPGTDVEISARQIASEIAYCEIDVRDHGEGVDEADLERIFDPFFKAGQERRGLAAGAGIGLAIAKKAAVHHHGEIRARNAQDGGLIVTVKLPLVAH